MSEFFALFASTIHPGLPRRYATTIEQRERNSYICNCTTFCYFTLALFLIFVGTAITVLTLSGHVGFALSLGHLWVIGPIFICSGLMIAIKSILYARRQTMVAILTRRRELNGPLEDIPSPRDPASYILPPSYDAIAGECSTQTATHLVPPSYGGSPPCYKEAILGSDIELIHYQGIKGYSLSKPDNLNDYDYGIDGLDSNKERYRRSQ